ncbi:MAG: alternative ribosome rescue aminoacyl-tRNA hydrolase ArfB [Salibacteraceae bacterium]
MSRREVNIALIISELKITTSRSGGPGGQHANKVETRVQLRFNVFQSEILTEEEKETIKIKCVKKLTNEGDIIVTCEDKRSQLKNKEIALQKLDVLLKKAFEKPKVRKPTKISKAKKAKRLTNKKIHGVKKSLRGRVKPDE